MLVPCSNPHDNVLINILRQRTEDIDLKRHAVECMKRSGSLAYTVSHPEWQLKAGIPRCSE